MAIYDGADLWYPMPFHVLASAKDDEDDRAIKFNLAEESDLIERYDPGAVMNLTANEWRVYSIIQARCAVGGHTAEISNRFLEHFANVGRNKLPLVVRSLEYVHELIRTDWKERANSRAHRYWIRGRKKQTFDGGVVWTEERRAAQVTKSREAGRRRKKKAEDDADTWGTA
jgi:hypothetical protein